MARSFATAVQSDDRILAAVRGQEEHTINDRVLAQQLAGVTQPDGLAIPHPRASIDDAQLASLARYNRAEPKLSSPSPAATFLDRGYDIGETRRTKREREVSANGDVDEDNDGRSKRSQGEVTSVTVVLGSKRKRSASPNGQAEVLPPTSLIGPSLNYAEEEAIISVTSNKRARTSTVDERATEGQLMCISCGTEWDSGLSLGTCEHHYCEECVTL